MTRVTVGVTCYEARDTIARAVASAAAQTWPDVEILVVDDASTDGSAEVAEAALRDFPNGRLIRRPVNGGVAAARNTLLAEATGRYIAFFDDDDESAPDRIAVQVARIQAEPAADGVPVLCFASGARRYPNGYEIQAPAIGSQGRPPQGDEVVGYLLVNRRAPDAFYGAGTPSCALLAPVAALRAVGGYDETLGRAEDVDIAIRLALAGGRFVGCRERLYLQHATPGSDKTPARNLAAELAVVDKHRAWLERQGLYRHAQAWFQFREAWFSRRRGEALRRALGLALDRPVLTVRRLVQSGPARLAHEGRMNRDAGSA
ncbi:MAG: glycosyltransferase family 2 protein [Caulobacterales bacterium]|nr:glycosyltransferase family 2 protein [Caulobacterales bacterium]